jgi:hypothetical protein
VDHGESQGFVPPLGHGLTRMIVRGFVSSGGLVV